jgi:predicted Zn-dependent protease
MTRFFLVLGLMAACGVIVALGDKDSSVSLDSAREIWADVLRDTDAVGMTATRVAPAREMQFGNELAAQAARWGEEDPIQTAYVTAVGAQLTPHVHRNEIGYHFHVLRSPGVNAFAMPGGHIYVLTGLLDFLHSESELAAILGHEISHVDLRHCIERYQYQLAARKIGVAGAGEILDIAHSLAAEGYTQYQELDADSAGEALAIAADYDPDAAAAVFKRMEEQLGERKIPAAKTPAGEVGQAIDQAIGSYFRSHPPSSERSQKLIEMTAANHRTLSGRRFYKGESNYRERVPRSAESRAEEYRVY